MLAPRLALLALALVLVGARPAAARTERELGYTPDAIWATVVRFLRVTEDVTVIEKDREAGYVIFQLSQDKRTFRGTLELIAVQKDHGVRLVLHIADRPNYVETMMLDRLERKLLGELGAPPDPPKKPAKPVAPPPPPDADKPSPKESGAPSPTAR